MMTRADINATTTAGFSYLMMASCQYNRSDLLAVVRCLLSHPEIAIDYKKKGKNARANMA